MILRRPNAILHMTTESPGCDGAQPFFVVEKSKVLLDLKMAEVMPVTHLGRVEFFQQPGDFALTRDLLVAPATFDSEPDILRVCVLDDSA